MKKYKKAFSLLELSIVIVIIGLLLAGVIGAKHIIKKSQLQAAIAITKSSPINSILDNKLWLESALAEISLGDNLQTGDSLTSWQNNSEFSYYLSISAVGSGPTYSNSINNIQAVKFDSNSATNHLQIDNPEFLNDTDYTIFITEKRIANNGSGQNYLLSDQDGDFSLGYESENKIIQTHGQSASNDNQANIENISSYSNKPRVITFIHSSTDGNKIYINATLANEDSSDEAKAHLSGLSSLNKIKIGNNYNGEIGEIAIFSRALKSAERISIEDYLTKKWNSPNNRDNYATCLGGTILSNGCDASCVVSVIGSSTARIASGASQQISCDQAGYTGSTTETYSCSDGSLSPSISNTQCLDDNGCDSGYIESSGTCIVGCTVNINGSSTTHLTDGSSQQFSCNQTGYTGSTTQTYTCTSGSLTPTPAVSQCLDDNGCDTGYISSLGICSPECNISSQLGLATDTIVGSNTTSIDCDTDFVGTIDYSCSGGTATVSDNSCECSSTTVLRNDECHTAFITTWNTENSGTSASNQIKLPLISQGTYDFTVDWGDGSTNDITSYNQAEITHTYSSPGIYTVKIGGTYVGFRGQHSDNQKLINISQWGPVKLNNDSSFSRINASITITATDVLDTSAVTTMQSFFENTAITSFPNMGSWDVSNVTNFHKMFRSAINFNEPSIVNWDTSSAVNMGDMFNNSGQFSQNIGSWNISNLTSFGGKTFSTAIYDQILIGWASQSVQSGVSASFSNSKYTPGGAAEAARNTLINTYGWNIADGGAATP